LEQPLGVDLLTLIKACAEHGVSQFEYKDLKISFNAWPTFNGKQAVQSFTEGEPAKQPSPSMDDLLIERPDLYEDELVRATNEE
jgi:hypothetical protein